MSLSKPMLELLLSRNMYLNYLCVRRTYRRYGVHPINQERKKFGEFHHLYPKLRQYPDKFFSYARMSIETFDFLLNKVKEDLTKQVTNFCRPISPEERLIVTLR